MEVTSSHHAGRGPYLTPKQVMDLLNISENTIYHELRDGSLRDVACRIGRQWRVSSRALDDLLSGSK